MENDPSRAIFAFSGKSRYLSTSAISHVEKIAVGADPAIVAGADRTTKRKF